MLADLRALFARIALNSLWLFLARVSSQGLMLIFTILVARYLGQAGLGQYAFVTAIVFLGNVLTTFGLDTLLIREMTRARTTAATSVTAALWIQLGLSALFIGGVGLGTRWLPHLSSDAACCAPTTALALRLYSLSLIPLAFTTAFSASLRAYERMDLILALNLLSSLVQTGGALLLLRTGGDLIALVVFLLAIQILTALVAGGTCFRWLPGFALALRIPPYLIWQMLRLGAPLVLVAGIIVAHQRMGVLMLSLLANDALTGWFAAAIRVADALKMLHYAFFGAIFPLMSRLAVARELPEVGRDAGGLERGLSQVSLRFLLSFGVLAALAVTLLAKPLVHLLYGVNYSPSALALQILVWNLIPFALSTHTFFWLVSRGKETTALKVIVIAVASTAILNIFLIPIFGLIGACLATLTGESIQAVLYLPYARHGIVGNTRASPYSPRIPRFSSEMGPFRDEGTRGLGLGLRRDGP